LLPSGKVLVSGGSGAGLVSAAELYDPAAGTWTPTGSLATARVYHTATLLANGKVLVVGGAVGGSVVSSGELYDPAAGTWGTTGSLAKARGSHTATLLADGSVLVAGGYDAGGLALSSAELYDPATGTWTLTGSLATGRLNHTATLLSNGAVLAVGGYAGSGVYRSSAELYDPVGRTWTPTGSLATARSLHTTTLLPDGTVLVAGGSGSGTFSSAELYNPATGTFANTNSLAAHRYGHTASLLPTGRVLVVGGFAGSVVPSAEMYDPAAGTWAAMSSLGTARDFHTATLLPSGKVLVAGGYGTGGALSSAELHDPTTGAWTLTGSLATARSRHTATLLPNGKALVAGGDGGGLFPLSSAELYDPGTGVWTTTADLTTARYGHTATLLPSGRVLVAGGDGGGFVPLASVDVYDPSTGTWTPTGSLAIARYNHTATLLPSGKVLVAGGSGSGYLLSAELYDPAAGTWTTTGSLNASRERHSATLLPDGKVLEAGGINGGDGILFSAELYDPATETWTPTGSLAVARYGHTATLLASGEVLVAGGNFGDAVAASELYDPASGLWTTTAPLAAARFFHRATSLSRGKALVTAGIGGAASTELYDPETGSWTTADSLAAGRLDHTATLLPNGQVLVAGGDSSLGGPALSSAELYAPVTGLGGLATPLLTFASTPVEYGAPLVVTGTGLGGGWEASGGNTASSAVNYPLFQIRSVESGQTSWLIPDARANFSDNPMTLTFSSLPATLDPGWHYLTAVRAALASKSRLVEVACSLAITQQPLDQVVPSNATATFAVTAEGARSYQWQYCDTGVCPEGDWVDRPGATAASYTTEAISGSLSGRKYRAIVRGACAPPAVQACSSRPEGCQASAPARVTVFDTQAPAAVVVSPDGGERWLLSEGAAPPNTQPVLWSMSDDVRICQATVSLLYSTDGGVSYMPAPSGGGLPATFGTGGSCVYPGVTTSNLIYAVPSTSPSGVPGSLYKIALTVADETGLSVTVTSANPFYIVKANPAAVKTLILWNSARTGSLYSGLRTAALAGKLQEIAGHPQVQGLVVDLAEVTSLDSLYAAWDAAPSDPSLANTVLFGSGGVHETLLSLLSEYSGVQNVILAGDDRIIPFARLADHTALFSEASYVDGVNLTSAGTTVGQALSADKFLSDDPMGVLDSVTGSSLDSSLHIPDLAVGRLVETPEEMITAIATFISQDGVLDLSALDPSTGHKVLVTGYDFLTDAAKSVRDRWQTVLGDPNPGSGAPVDAALIGDTWNEASIADRVCALRERFDGNGGSHYALMSFLDHATHFEVGVPGISQLDIQGLDGQAIAGSLVNGSCSYPGPIDLSGAVVYGVGCHAGLPVAGSSAPEDHPQDLAQTFLARGVVAYVANTGYGWGLKHGTGYGERLVRLLTGRADEQRDGRDR
jgi:hypothetical protein